MSDILDFNTSDFEEDRYDRLRLIPWWDQERLANARILVVGAGAIGNELIKNLTLLGIGEIFIVDMDLIESTNLTRSILFRASDVGSPKAEIAAQRASEINPDVRAHALIANIIDDVGLGVFRRMDVVLGALDNREARLAINQCCYRVGVPWIDGAIEALSGIARVFMPPDGACYECTMTEMDWKLLNKRKSCALLTHEQVLEGKIPTTPTSSSVIAGIQVQEMLKILHRDRELPTLAGKGFVFNGLTHDSYVVEYQRKEDCMSHAPLAEIKEMPWKAGTVTLKEIIEEAAKQLGKAKGTEKDDILLEFDRDIVSGVKCACGHAEERFLPLHKLRGDGLVCPECGKTMDFSVFHSVAPGDSYTDKTPLEIGIPPLHIVTCRAGGQSIHFEFSGDETER